MLNQADVIGDQSDAVTQNAWFRWALCAAISGEISILIQTGAESWEGFLYQESTVGRVPSNMNSVFVIYIIHVADEFRNGALDLDYQDQIGLQTSTVFEKIEPFFTTFSNLKCESTDFKQGAG